MSPTPHHILGHHIICHIFHQSRHTHRLSSLTPTHTHTLTPTHTHTHTHTHTYTHTHTHTYRHTDRHAHTHTHPQTHTHTHIHTLWVEGIFATKSEEEW